MLPFTALCRIAAVSLLALSVLWNARGQSYRAPITECGGHVGNQRCCICETMGYFIHPRGWVKRVLQALRTG
jgi:hypothetical protein